MLETIKKIEKITKGERFITSKQLEKLQLIPEVYAEHAGESGTGKGQLYVLYFMQDGEKTDKEIGEVVVTRDEREELIQELNENAYIEHLQEVGKINLDTIDYNLQLLIEVLKEDFDIETEIQTQIGGQYLVNLDFEK